MSLWSIANGEIELNRFLSIRNTPSSNPPWTNFLWWVEAAVLLPPLLCVCLQLHILKVDFPGNLLHVALGNVVGGVGPVWVLRELGQLLPGQRSRWWEGERKWGRRGKRKERNREERREGRKTEWEGEVRHKGWKGEDRQRQQGRRKLPHKEIYYETTLLMSLCPTANITMVIVTSPTPPTKHAWADNSHSEAFPHGSMGKRLWGTYRKVPYTTYYKPMGDLPYIISEQGLGL